MSASAGRVLIMPRGNYSSTTQYHMLDFVLYNNASYLCKKNSIGNAPSDSEYWQIAMANVFNGTRAEWEALSASTKSQFTTVIITDD